MPISHRQRRAALLGVCAALAPIVLSTGSAGAAGGGDATLYLIQGVDDTAITLSLDGKRLAAEAAPKAIVGPLRLQPGRHVVQAKSADGAPVEATVQLAAGSSTDVVLHRQVDPTQPPVLTTFPNDVSAVTPGSGRLTVAHTAAVGPADIRVRGKVLFANVANGEELSLTVPAGTYPVDIVPSTASGPVVFGPADVSVQAAELTRVFAIGVAATDSMDAVVQVIPVASRGTGRTPERVDAGDGGQAQSRIDALAARQTPSENALPAGVLSVLLLGGAAALARRQRASRPRT
jgi:hypothetical protein